MNNYEILGVNKNSSKDEIKKAYRNLVKIHHPDVGGNAEKFKQINDAYDVLSDDKKKSDYDRELTNQYDFGTEWEDVMSHNFYDFMRNAKKEFREKEKNKSTKKQIFSQLTFTELYNGCTKKFNINLNDKIRTIEVNIPKFKQKVIFNVKIENNDYEVTLNCDIIPIDTGDYKIYKHNNNINVDVFYDRIGSEVSINLFFINQIIKLLKPRYEYLNKPYLTVNGHGIDSGNIIVKFV